MSKLDEFEIKRKAALDFLKNKKIKRIKNVYLHIGLHKTASTSIQNTLFDNHDSLIKYDYLYPTSIGKNHGNFLITLASKDPLNMFDNIEMQVDELYEKMSNFIKDFVEECKNSKCSKLIISAEDLSFLDREEVSNLAEILYRFFPKAKINIVVSTRENFSFLQSDYQQAIKMGYYIDMDKHINYCSQLFRTRLQPYLHKFKLEDIIIYKFEDAIKSADGPVKYFAKKINMDDTCLDNLSVRNANVGISNNAMELLEFINSKEPLIKNKKKNLNRKKSDTFYISLIRGSKYQITENYREKIKLVSKDDKEWLLSNFGIEYLDDDKAGENNKIKYDDLYVLDLVDAMKKSDVHIQKLIRDFLIQKRDNTENFYEKKIFSKLIRLFSKNTIDKNKVREIHKKRIDNFIKKANMPNAKTADHYRELALLNEEFGQVETALFFMKIAREHRPEGSFIAKKCKEYEEKIRNE